VPLVGWRLGYVPRGPVGQLEDPVVRAALLEGLRELGRSERVATLKVDPEATPDSELGAALLASPWRASAKVQPPRTRLIDLGPDDYNLPQYFGAKRFTYYRLRTEGHNTLAVGAENQALDAKAPIVAYSDKPDAHYAVADLSTAYPQQLKRWLRGINLFDGERVWLQDEVEPRAAVDVFWQMHTTADVRVEGAIARLKLNGVEWIASIQSPRDAKFEVQDVHPPEPQRQDPSVKKLTIRFSGLSTTTTIAVAFTPANGPLTPLPDLRPLQEWIKAAPLARDR